MLVCEEGARDQHIHQSLMDGLGWTGTFHHGLSLPLSQMKCSMVGSQGGYRWVTEGLREGLTVASQLLPTFPLLHKMAGFRNHAGIRSVSTDRAGPGVKISGKHC